MVGGTELITIREFFYKNGVRMRFRRKEIIIFQGDIVNDVYFVSQGIYKTYSIDEYGEERTISIAGRDNILPISWQMIKQPKNGAINFYEAYSDVVVYRTSQEVFRNMLNKNIKLAYYLLDASTRTNIGLESRVQSLQKSKVEEKTEFILYFLAKRLGRTEDGRIFEIEKSVTQQDIADLAGVNRETAARFLLSMQSSKLAWKAGSNYYIDISKLNSNYTSPVYS